VLGILLVYAATRDWFAANNLDPEYYLKRHTINVLIGILLAWAATLIDYRMIRAFAPVVWGLGVLGLILVLVPGIGATVNDPAHRRATGSRHDPHHLCFGRHHHRSLRGCK